MIMNFDKFKRYETPSAILCYPSSRFVNDAPTDTIGEIPFCTDNEFVFNFGDTSTFSFRAKLVKETSAIYEMNNYIYRKILKKMYIFIPDVGYFRIEEVKETITDYESYKDVEAVSCECELAERIVPFFEDGEYLITDLLYGTLDYVGINSVIQQWDLTTATMAEDIDSDLLPPVDAQSDAPYRRFLSYYNDNNVFDFFLDTLQQTYDCVFTFDIIHRKLKIIQTENYKNSADTSVHITKEDVVREVQITDSRDSTITALRGKTKDGDTFAAINPTGESYVYDLTEYIEWMPSSLKQKVQTWANNISNNESLYYTSAIAYANANKNVLNCEAEIARLEMLKAVYQRCLINITAYEDLSCVDVYNGELPAISDSERLVPAGTVADTKSAIQSKINNVLSEESTQSTLRDGYISARSAAANQMASIRAICSFNEFFNQGEQMALNTYLFSGTYTVDSISVSGNPNTSEVNKLEALRALYRRTKYKLSEIHMPIPSFNISTDNFVFAIKFKKWTDQLRTGALINVETRNNEVTKLFISSMTINYGDRSSSFTFSHALRNNNARTLFRDVFENISVY